MDQSEARKPPAHGLSVNATPLLTIVSMESGSEENRLCHGSDEGAGTWPSGSILGGPLPRSIFADVKCQLSLSGSQNEDKCVEQESLCRGGRMNRSTRTTGSDATDLILISDILVVTHQPDESVFLETSSVAPQCVGTKG